MRLQEATATNSVPNKVVPHPIVFVGLYRPLTSSIYQIYLPGGYTMNQHGYLQGEALVYNGKVDLWLLTWWILLFFEGNVALCKELMFMGFINQLKLTNQLSIPLYIISFFLVELALSIVFSHLLNAKSQCFMFKSACSYGFSYSWPPSTFPPIFPCVFSHGSTGPPCRPGAPPDGRSRRKPAGTAGAVLTRGWGGSVQWPRH